MVGSSVCSTSPMSQSPPPTPKNTGKGPFSADRGIRFSGAHDEHIQANLQSLFVSGSGAAWNAAAEDIDEMPMSCLENQLDIRFRKLTRHIDTWMEHHEILIKTLRPMSDMPPSSGHRGTQGNHANRKLGSIDSHGSVQSSNFRSIGTSESAYGDLRAVSLASSVNHATIQEVGKSMRYTLNNTSSSAGSNNMLEWTDTTSAPSEQKDLDKIQPIRLKKKKKDGHGLKRNFSTVSQSFTTRTPKEKEESVVSKNFCWPNDIGQSAARNRLASIISDEDHERKSQAHAEGIRKTRSAHSSHQPSDMTSRTHSIKTQATEAVTSAARSIVHGTMFPALIAGLILTNALFVGVDVEWSATQPEADTPVYLLIIGYAYSAAFMVELILRLAADGTKFFYEKGFLWNYLDFALVLISLAEIVLDVVNAARGSENTNQVKLMRLIRITRLLRVIRVVRVIRFVHALRTLVHSILSTLRSLLWAMILLTMIIYVFGIIFTSAATTYFEENTDVDARVFWSSLGRSLFTLFKSVSGGLSWHEAVVPLGNMHPMYVFLFLVFVAFTYFAVLNVVTGVFCQSAVESAHHDYDLVIASQLRNQSMYKQKIKNLFEEIDQHGTGEITIDEFEQFLESPNTQAYFASLELDTGDAWTLFKLLDVDTSHQLDMEEFLMGCLRLRGSAKAIEVAKMQYENKIMRHKLMEFIVFSETCFRVLFTHLSVSFDPATLGSPS